MQIKCDKCGARLTIPDEKIPAGRTVTGTCPKCKARFAVPSTKGETKHKKKDVKGQAYASKGYEYDEDDSVLDLFGEGLRPALIMVDDMELSEQAEKTIESLGYKGIYAFRSRDAIEKLRLHQFDLIIIPEYFDGNGVENSPIIKYLNNLSMSVRRKMFVVLLSDNFKTMDTMMAFALSLNLIINIKDMDKMALILKQAISENERRYKVFNDILSETGHA